MSVMFQGIGVSRGFGIGPAHVLERDQQDINEIRITASKIDAEVERFERAITTARTELRAVLDSIPGDTHSDIEAFIETHLLMLDDPMLHDMPIRILRERRCNAEWALKLQRDRLVDVFEAMADPYLRTRKDDIDHVIQRVQAAMLSERDNNRKQKIQDWHGQIVVADDLTPADTLQMQNQGVAGFITESGGQLSHTAILARSLGIPAAVGVHNARRYLVNGEQLILDGQTGMVIANPGKPVIKHYRARQRELKSHIDQLVNLKDTPTVTLDGTAVSLQANIEIKEDLTALKSVNAIGVGLYRTEFLYLNRPDTPNEEEHYETYIQVLRALDGAPLTIRTVDLGSDKEPDTVHLGPLAHNPALGLRGIRRCLLEPGMFVPQLRAILRASAKGPINIMFPMLTNISEVRQTLTLLDYVKSCLRDEGQLFDESVAVGGMIEVPAAAISAHQFAQHLNFLSIGTNDLIQYTLAIDRIDDEVNYLYDPLHPAVLKLIHQVILAGKAADIPVSMCGEMAGNPQYIRLLLGLGLRDFSMPPNSILEARQVIKNTRLEQVQSYPEKLMNTSDTVGQHELLAELNAGLDEFIPGYSNN